MRVISNSSAAPGLRGVLYVLFGLSGFSGLIYESIWSHYLKLFLGHAAYAQTLVLCIFMAGMALGAWLIGRWSSRIRNPLLVYVGVEGLLGIAALCFDAVFRSVQSWFFDSAIPQLPSPSAVDAAKWGLAAVIILPQSVLLGSTFPLMSAGLVRHFPDSPGRSLGWLYFTNSMGAAVGVLASGFVLVERVGLPGTSLTAGLINFGLAMSVYLLARSILVSGKPAAPLPPVAGGASASSLLLAVAALTGAASFFYEIAWIRMLSLVIGAATHSFELMLSSFITGLALGSFYIRGRIDANLNPRRLLGWIQVIMGALALLSIPLYLGLFDAMAWWLHAIDRNEAGYQLFTAFAYALCFLLMLPATFCAGMTLPLLTSTLMREAGERAIGRIYAANTLGSIAGVVLAVHVVMPYFGLRAVLIAGAAVDIALGISLLAAQAQPLRHIQRLALACAAIPLLAIIFMVPFDPQITSSGVFRTNDARSPDEMLFHQDGKTATVDVGRTSLGNTYISTNGKVDAALTIGGKASLDDHTMILLGLLPLGYVPQAQQVAVIGMGSGRSTHALLHSPTLREVHTIEIEPAMVEGAKLFGPETIRTFTDPRSRIHIEDAKTYFARSGRQYDLIVSEPSNPWVSGVSSLFSQEFYQQTQRYLAPGGLFIQWFHLYEIDSELSATVLNALGNSFSDYVIYATNSADIIIVASPQGRVPELTDSLFRQSEFKPLLDHLSIRTLADFQIRRVGTKATLSPLSRAINPVANSDYFPVLDQGAAKRRYIGSNAVDFVRLNPLSARLELGSARLSGVIEPIEGQAHSLLAANAHRLGQYAAWREGRVAAAPENVDPSLQDLYFNLTQSLRGDCHPDTLRGWLDAVRALTVLYAPYIETAVADRFSEQFLAASCYARLDETSRLWASLFQSISRDDWVSTQRWAERMLALHPRGFSGDTFVMTELVLADIRAAGAERAASRLRDLGPRVPKSFQMLYLRSNIGF